MKKLLAAVAVATLMATNAIASTLATVNLDGVAVDGATTTTLTQTVGAGTVTDIAFNFQVLHQSPSWGSETQVSIQAPDGSTFSFGGGSSFGFGNTAGVFSFVGSFAVAATSAAGDWIFSFTDGFNDYVNPDYVFLRPSSVSLNGISPVPLPAAGFLLLGALGGLGLMRRRRKAA